MKLLIIGNGGREHALVTTALKSTKFSQVFQLPKNDAFENSLDIDINDNKAIVDFALSNQIDITIVGSEQPLANGLVDDFEQNNLKIFGPTKYAAQLESSKTFAKNLMKQLDVTTASFKSFDNLNESIHYVSNSQHPLVIKYDGLAQGKGVYIADDLEQSIQFLTSLHTTQSNFKVVIEQFLEGEEFSAFFLVNNRRIVSLPIIQDFKKIGENDTGENTGGMGAVTTSKFDHLIPKITDTIVAPIINYLDNNGTPFNGILYAGLMQCEDDIYVIEFNTRLGDPETELLVNKVDNNIVDVIVDFVNDQPVRIETNPQEFIGVVLAAGGYPASYQVGDQITGLEKIDNYYFMNIKKDNEKIITNGGRVLFIYGQGQTYEQARTNVYEDIKALHFENMYYRKDINKRS